MPSAHKEVGARLTPAQLAAVTEAAERAGVDLAQFIRWGLSMACASQGVDMPDDMPGRGTYPRPPRPQRQ